MVTPLIELTREETKALVMSGEVGYVCEAAGGGDVHLPMVIFCKDVHTRTWLVQQEDLEHDGDYVRVRPGYTLIPLHHAFG